MELKCWWNKPEEKNKSEEIQTQWFKSAEKNV